MYLKRGENFLVYKQKQKQKTHSFNFIFDQNSNVLIIMPYFRVFDITSSDVFVWFVRSQSRRVYSSEWKIESKPNSRQSELKIKTTN